MTTKHPDYAILAARIAVSNLHKETKKTFSGNFHPSIMKSAMLIWRVCFLDVIDDLFTMTNKNTGKNCPMISVYHHGIIMKNADRLNSAIIYDRDFNYNYFGFKVDYIFHPKTMKPHVTM